MMKKVFIVLISVFFTASSFAARINNNATFSLLTVTPGDELYSTFGHSGIRLLDTSIQVDIVFNYGMFDFNTPNFYYVFARGKLNYCIAVENYGSFVSSATIENRGVSEQILNLSTDEKQRLFNLLATNMQPENRYYKYDFLYDNCATRIRDIINKAVYPDTVFRNVPEKNSKTFRKLLSQYLKTSPWEHAGIDIVLGLPDDKPANSYDATFLPDYLSFATAKAVRKNGQALVSSTAAISSVEKTPVNPLTNPVLLIGLVILGLSILSIYRKNLAKVNDVFLLTIISLIGFVICFLWFASDLAATKNNLNLLWALPTNIFAYIFVQKLIWRKYYFGFAGILSLVIFIMSWYPQQLHYALYPLILAVIIRSINISYSCQNELKKI